MIHDQRPFDMQIHDPDCPCRHCKPQALQVPDRLDAVAIGKLVIAGVLVGNAVAFVVDPVGSTATLAGCLRWWFL